MYDSVGYYHSIETFGTVDGPGIRYVLFLSGCKLGCAFCHNPDTWSVGKRISVREVINDMLKYKSFYQSSGGGITISGGEPVLQADFVCDLLKACKNESIHTIVDTAGYGETSNFDKFLPYTDKILFSIKAIDNTLHRKLTVCDNEQILNNLQYIADKVEVVVRYVILPGLTGKEEDLKKLAEFLLTLPTEVTVELLGYHTMGKAKWDGLGWNYKLKDIRPANKNDLEKAKNILIEQNITAFY